MLSIRLRRAGTTKKPHYRVVVADSRDWRDGRFVEVLGHYDRRCAPGRPGGGGPPPGHAVRRGDPGLTAKAFADMVTIGRIVRPQGRKGEVVVEPLSDRPDRFPSLRQAFVAGEAGSAQPVRVHDAWPHKGRFV